MKRLAFARLLLRHRALRSVGFGYATFSIAEHATWLAVIVFAYERGGVRESGIMAFVVLMASGVAAPLTAWVADRGNRLHTFAIGLAAQAVFAALTAIAMLTGGPYLLSYAAALLMSAAITMTRPAMAAVLPLIATSMESLTAANAAAQVVATMGLFAGPALGAALLTWSSPGMVFAAAAGLLLTGAIASLLVADAALSEFDDGDLQVASDGHSLLAGLRVVRESGSVRLLIAILSGIVVVAGALDVAFAAVAVELLEGGDATIGVLAAATGLGGLIGAVLSLMLVGRRRLTMPMIAGACAVGLPIALLAWSDTVLLAVVFLVVSGAGQSTAEVAGLTMLQGLAAEDVRSRLFGVLEAMTMFALAVGALGFVALVEWLGLESALVVLGALVPVLLVISLRRLLLIDRDRPEVDSELVALARRMPIFGALPAFAVEQLLRNVDRVEFAPDEPVFDRGDTGENFYLISDGSALVTLAEGGTVALAAGEFFGEIALLHDVPRTASVAAGVQGMVVYSMGAAVFLEAVTGVPLSHARTARIAQQRRDRG